MRRHVRLLVLLLLFAVVGIAPAPAAATYGVDQFRMDIWMLPPVDNLGSTACLKQGWHSSDPRFDYMRALDWHNVCTGGGTELVRFRALAASIDTTNDGTFWAGGYGVTSNLTVGTCGGQSLHIGKVNIWSADGTVKGFMIYAHSVLYNSSQFNINFKRGGTRTNAHLTSVGIGNTVQDGPSTCWTGWHVHENNSDDAVMRWDQWNSLYSGTPPHTDTYTNNSPTYWIRRMQWIDQPFE